MPAFEYEALDAGGRARRGVVSADSPRQARAELRRLALTPVNLSAPRERKVQFFGAAREARISQDDLVAVTRQLAALIDASTPLEEALGAVALQSEKPQVRSRLLMVRERVVEGWRFADALGEDPKSFPDVFRAVIAAGETSGELAGVLERLATMLEKNRTMRNKAIAALIYPAAIAIVAGSVVIVLMTLVVPRIVEQFDTFGARLPFITRLVMDASAFISAYGLLCALAAVIAAIAFWRAMKTPAFRLAFDRRALRLPVVGRLLRGLDGARFARTLATLVAGGAPLLDSLAGAQRTVENAHIRARLELAIGMVREGSNLSSALRRAEALPPMMVNMVASGERAGAVPALLDKSAAQLEDEFDTALSIALRLLEPAIIVALGGAVMLIVAAVMLPLLRLNALAAG